MCCSSRASASSPRASATSPPGSGQLHIHPIYPHPPGVPEIIVFDTGAQNLPDADTWHSDVSCIEMPPMGAILGGEAAAGERRRYELVEHDRGL